MRGLLVLGAASQTAGSGKQWILDDCRKNYEGCRCRDRGHTFNNLGPSHPGQGLPMLLAHPMPCICPEGASCFGKGQEFS